MIVSPLAGSRRALAIAGRCGTRASVITMSFARLSIHPALVRA
jgi:hypothetical protein